MSQMPKKQRKARVPEGVRSRELHGVQLVYDAADQVEDGACDGLGDKDQTLGEFMLGHQVTGNSMGLLSFGKPFKPNVGEAAANFSRLRSVDDPDDAPAGPPAAKADRSRSWCVGLSVEGSPNRALMAEGTVSRAGGGMAMLLASGLDGVPVGAQLVAMPQDDMTEGAAICGTVLSSAAAPGGRTLLVLQLQG